LGETMILVGAEEKFVGTVGIDGDRVAVSITAAKGN